MQACAHQADTAARSARALGPADRVTGGSILQTQRRCGCSDESCVRRSCAAGDLPACAGVDVSWTPPWVPNTLSKCHRSITSRASGLVQIVDALSESIDIIDVGIVSAIRMPIEVTVSWVTAR